MAMRCYDISYDRLQKFVKSPEGDHVPVWDITHKQRCSHQLYKLKDSIKLEEDNEDGRCDDLEEGDCELLKDDAAEDASDEPQQEISGSGTTDTGELREHFRRFLPDIIKG